MIFLSPDQRYSYRHHIQIFFFARIHRSNRFLKSHLITNILAPCGDNYRIIANQQQGGFNEDRNCRKTFCSP